MSASDFRALEAKPCRGRLLFPAVMLALAAAVARADDRIAAAVDLYGDAIPAGAAVRLGTVRYRADSFRTPPLFVDGDETLISLDGSRQLAVLEAATGKRIRVIELGDQIVNGMRLSPDRRSVITLGNELRQGPARAVQIVNTFDLESGKLLRTLTLPERFGSEIFALTPDGRTIVTAARDGTLSFLDLTSGDGILNYKLDQRGIVTLAISPDGKLIAASGSNSVYLWEWTAGKEPEKIPADPRVAALAFSPDGSILAEGPDSRGELVLRDVKSRKILRKLEDAAGNPMYVKSLAFTPDGRSLIAPNSIGLRGREIEYRLHVWDVATGAIRRQFATGGMRASQIAVSGDGHWVAATEGFFNATLKVWDLSTGELKGAAMPVHDGQVSSIQLSPDGTVAVTASHDGTVRIWDATTGKQQHLLRHANGVRACALSSDGRMIASSSLDDTVRLWDASTGNELYRLPGHGDLGGQRAVAFAADQSSFASWGDDFYLRVWDVKTGKALREWRVYPHDLKLPEVEDEDDRFVGGDFRMRVDQGAFSPNARTLVLVHGQAISIFDVATGQLQSSLTNPDGRMFSLAVSAGAAQIATSAWGRVVRTKPADDGTLPSFSSNSMARVFEVATGAERFRVELAGNAAGPVAFSADGRWLAVASRLDEAAVRLLDAGFGAERATITNLPAGACALCFSADGRRLACGFRDGTSLVWDLEVPGKK
jgi:WD40 repeat protein